MLKLDFIEGALYRWLWLLYRTLAYSIWQHCVGSALCLLKKPILHIWVNCVTFRTRKRFEDTFYSIISNEGRSDLRFQKWVNVHSSINCQSTSIYSSSTTYLVIGWQTVSYALRLVIVTLDQRFAGDIINSLNHGCLVRIRIDSSGCRVYPPMVCVRLSNIVGSPSSSDPRRLRTYQKFWPRLFRLEHLNWLQYRHWQHCQALWLVQ